MGYGTTDVNAKDLCSTGSNTDCEEDEGTFSVSGGFAYEISDTTELTAKATYLSLSDLDMNDNGTSFTLDGSGVFSFLVGAIVRF